MTIARRVFVVGAACCVASSTPVALAHQASAGVPAPGEADEILVQGRLPRCARRLNDPKDLVDVSRQREGTQLMVVRDPKTGIARVRWDTDPIGGEDWQRAGTELRSYVFRAPDNGTPLCIGVRDAREPSGFGQLRRIVDAAPFREKAVRFSGYVATNRGGNVRFWLAAGKKGGGVIAGDSISTVALDRRVGWQPFAYEIPLVPKESWSISFGFLLWGPGDVWVAEPKLEVVTPRGQDHGLYGKSLR